MAKERKIDQFISAITLILYAVIIAIKWVMVYQSVPEPALVAIDVIRTIILCLVFLVLLYNALGSTDNFILKIVYIAIALFLIATAISVQIPVVKEFFIDHKIPLIL